MQNVKRIAISLPSELADEFQKAISRKDYSNRSKAVADIFRDYLSGIELQKDGNAVGTITLLYDHKKRGITEKLTDVQHDFGKIILSSMHVHLDHDNCLETIVAKGGAKDIEKLANLLISTKGVKHGKLCCYALH